LPTNDLNNYLSLFGLSGIIGTTITFIFNRKLKTIEFENTKRIDETNKRFQRDLEELKYVLANEKSEKDARRDYEYEARKRLYQEIEPLLFQLLELSDSAFRRIIRLANITKEGLIEDWLSYEYSYFTKTTIYRLIAPIASFRIIQEKLTLIDLEVDPSINFQYSVSKTVYDVISDDIDISKLAKLPQEYEPNDPNPSKRSKREGIFVGTIEKLTSDLIYNDTNKLRVKSYGEFESFCLSKDKKWKEPWNVVAELFTNFNPKKNYVLWRILITQSMLYYCLRLISKIRIDHPFSLNLPYLRMRIENKINWNHDLIINSNFYDNPFPASERYLKEKLVNYIDRT
jgi:hypothetical protein